VDICLQRGADLHMSQLMPLPLTVSCYSKIQVGFTFWYRLTRVVPNKGPLNGCVCVPILHFAGSYTGKIPHIFVQLPTSADKVTLPAFTCHCCSGAAADPCRNRSTDPVCWALSNKPATAVAKWDRQTDRRPTVAQNLFPIKWGQHE